MFISMAHVKQGKFLAAIFFISRMGLGVIPKWTQHTVQCTVLYPIPSISCHCCYILLQPCRAMHLIMVIWEMSSVTSSNWGAVRVFSESRCGICLTCIIDYSPTEVHRCTRVFMSDCWYRDMEVCQTILSLRDDGHLFNTADSHKFFHHGPDEIKQKVLQFIKLQGGKPFKYYCHGRFHTSLFHCIVINETSTDTPKMEWWCQNAFTISPLIKTTWRLFFAGLFTPCALSWLVPVWYNWYATL